MEPEPILSNTGIDLICGEELDLSYIPIIDIEVQETNSQYDNISPECNHDVLAYFQAVHNNAQQYKIDLQNFAALQYINPLMRVRLLHWMMQFAYDRGLKRATYYKAVYYVDKYIIVNPRTRHQKYQLIGIAALAFATKVEQQVLIPASYMVYAVANAYSQEQIQGMEQKLFRAVGFRAFPSSAYTYLAPILMLWDNFILNRFGWHPCNDLDSLIVESDIAAWFARFILFHIEHEVAIWRYQTTMQILDAACSDVTIYNYDPMYLALGIQYLMVTRYLAQTRYELLWYNGSANNDLFWNIASVFGNEEVENECMPQYADATMQLVMEFYEEQLGNVCIDQVNLTAGFFQNFVDLQIEECPPKYYHLNHQDMLTF